jgi:hypothetical protein
MISRFRLNELQFELLVRPLQFKQLCKMISESMNWNIYFPYMCLLSDLKYVAI